MRKALFGLIFFCLSFTSFGQMGDFLFKYFREKKSVTYGLNNRRTTLLQDNATIYGGYLGIKFGSQLKHMITFNSTLFWVGDYMDETGISNPLEVQLNFIGFSEEFVFWKKNRWAFASYLHIGAGQARFRETFMNEDLFRDKLVYPGEIGLHSSFAPIEWLEFRIGGGYRYVFNSKEIPLNGFYYKVGAGINLQKFKDWGNQVLEIGNRVNPAHHKF